MGGPFSAPAPGHALNRGAAARRVDRGPVSARRRSTCLGARAGRGGRRLLAGRPGCVCGLRVSWRSLVRHARRPSWARALIRRRARFARPASREAARRCPGLLGDFSGTLETCASWGVIRHGGVRFCRAKRARRKVGLECFYTLALFEPSQAPQAHALAPARTPATPLPPNAPTRAAKRSATPPRRAIFCHGGVRAPKPSRPRSRSPGATGATSPTPWTPSAKTPPYRCLKRQTMASACWRPAAAPALRRGVQAVPGA